MWTVITLLWACATAPPEAVRSQPIPPTVDLAKPAPSITWATIDGLFAKGSPAVPEALGGLALGQPEAEARAILARIKHPKLIAPDDRVHEGTTVVGARLEAFPEVGVSLLIRDGVLAELDLSVPAEESLFALTSAWGQPQESVTEGVEVPQPVWLTPTLRIALIATDGPSILKFARRES